MVDERVLYIDIETAVVGNKPDPKKDLLKYIGIRYPNGNKRMFSSNQLDMIKNVISQYKFIVGHNFKKRFVEGREMGYDQVVLERYGVKFYGKTIIDTMQILEKRGKAMMYLDLPPMPSLRWACKKFNLAHQKGEFDYNILKKPIMTMSEIRELQEYLFGDLDSGYDLFEYLYNLFYKFKKELSPKEQLTMGWLTSSPGTTAYKWFCYVTGKAEVYDKNPPKVPYQGALMWVNNKIKSIENVYVFDFSSLYPTMIVGGSLTNPIESNGWDGTGSIFEGYIKGMFSKEHGLFEKKLIDKFTERQEIKKEMKKLNKKTQGYKNLWFEQNGIKILMNSFYGATGNPVFKNLYDDRICSSITGMARACITHAKKYFEERGYVVVYQHTDSLYIHDTFNDEEKIKDIAKTITEIQRKDMNIYNPQHNFEFEKHLQKMWLIPKTDGKGNVKNRNIVLNDVNEISYTGIKLVGRQCSKVAKEVFKEYIEPKLKRKEEIGYSYKETLSWFKDIIKKTPKLAMKKYKVRSLTEYSSTTSQQFQISKRYGQGEHYLIPNKYIGAGKVSKIATLEELQNTFKNNWVSAVNYNGLMKDLIEFINPEERKLIR